MRLLHFSHHARAGNTYLVVLVIAMLTGLILTAYLKMVANQNNNTMRSQAWNRCIAISEAGVEEALSHLYKNGTTNGNLYTDGWWNLGGNYYKRRAIDDGIYEVTISQESNPVILSRGYTPIVQNYAWRRRAGPLVASLFWWGDPSDNYLFRTIRVETTADGMFAKGLVAKYWIDLNGNNIRTDSFDSGDPRYSTNGFYCLPLAKDNGDVATNSGLTNYNNVDIGNANIHGRVCTGPRGTVVLGPNGAVGSHAWHAAGKKGIQPGWFRDDMNVSFPDVPAPFSTGYFTPAPGNVGGTNYDLVLGDGKYLSTSNVKFNSRNTIFVNGKAVWWCREGLELGGQAQIVIAPNAQLVLYVGNTSGSGVAGKLSGNGVANTTGYATNFIYYGMKSNTSMDFSGNAAFTGAIYAPNAAISMNGSGNNIVDFCGSGVFSTVTMNGHYNFHYDESLGRFGPRRGYVIVSWNEI